MKIRVGNRVRVTSGPYTGETFTVDSIGQRLTGVVLYGHHSGPVMADQVELYPEESGTAGVMG